MDIPAPALQARLVTDLFEEDSRGLVAVLFGVVGFELGAGGAS